MKLFQKSALAVAIAAVPFLSVNAMEALDDATLSEMTGQAGVTIESSVTETGIKIGSIMYTDTDVEYGTTNATASVGGGSVLINHGGATNGLAADVGIMVDGGTYDETAKEFTAGTITTTQKIDIDANGNLITSTTNTSANKSQRIRVGNVELRSKDQAKTGADYDAKVGASLVSNLTMITEAGNSTADILNMTVADADNTYESTRDKVTAEDIRATMVNVMGATAAADVNMAIRTESSSKIHSLSVDALDGAISIRDLSFANEDGSLMTSSQTIWAVGGAAYIEDTTNPGTMIDNGGGVYIAGSDTTGTLRIGNIAIGGGDIGSVAIRNINQAGTVTRIYGHN